MVQSLNFIISLLLLPPFSPLHPLHAFHAHGCGVLVVIRGMAPDEEEGGGEAAGGIDPEADVNNDFRAWLGTFDSSITSPMNAHPH